MIDRREGIEAAIKYLLAKGRIRIKRQNDELFIFLKEYRDYSLKIENQYRR